MSPVAEDLVLDAASALVERLVGKTRNVARGSVVSKTARYDADRSSVARSIPNRQPSGWAAGHRRGSVSSRPPPRRAVGRPCVDDLGRPARSAERAVTEN